MPRDYRVQLFDRVYERLAHEGDAAVGGLASLPILLSTSDRGGRIFPSIGITRDYIIERRADGYGYSTREAVRAGGLGIGIAATI